MISASCVQTDPFAGVWGQFLIDHESSFRQLRFHEGELCYGVDPYIYQCECMLVRACVSVCVRVVCVCECVCVCACVCE